MASGLEKTVSIPCLITATVTGLLYASSRIYIAKTDVIEQYSLDYSQTCDFETIHNGLELPKQVADIQLKIHEIFYLGGEAVIVLEGLDNVLDFNYIYLGEEAQYHSKRTEPCSYLLKQAAVKNKRKEPLVGNDPVIKLV